MSTSAYGTRPGLRVLRHQHKYGVAAKEERVADGIIFHSKAERIRYQQLKLLEKSGQIRELELQPEYNCEVNGLLVCRVRWDFCYFDTSSGRVVIEDVKGVRTREYRLKRKLFEALYGLVVTEVSAREVFRG